MNRSGRFKKIVTLVLLFSILMSSFPMYGQGVNLNDRNDDIDKKLMEIGVEVDRGFTNIKNSLFNLRSSKNDSKKGIAMGEIYVLVEKIALDGEVILEPLAYPLYEGDNLAKIFDYIMGYRRTISRRNLAHNLNGSSEYKNSGSLDEKFEINAISGDSNIKKMPDKISKYILNEGIEFNEQKFTDGWIARDDYVDGSDWLLKINNIKRDDYLSSITSDFKTGELSNGDVVVIQYSPIGDALLKITKGINKDELIKELGKINSYEDKEFLLSDSKYKDTYDRANTILSSLDVTQQEVDNIVKELKNKPQKADVMKPENHIFDFLMGNIDWRLRTGEEFELTALDVPRADDDSNNYVRDDLFIKPVFGADKVEIRRAPGSESNAKGNANMKKGSTYFVKALRQGVVKLKVSHPGYKGRDTYVVLHITNRESDYSNPIKFSSNLDKITKYDTIHFSDKTGEFIVNYSYLLDTDSFIDTKILVNGKIVQNDESYYTNEDGKKYSNFISKINLKNGYNTIIFSMKDKKNPNNNFSRVYNIRASYLVPKITNKTSPGEKIKAGDEIFINFDGLVQPLPKISRLYNPSQAQIYYYTDLPRQSQVRGGSSQWEISSSGITLEVTGSGKFKLYDGTLKVNRFGGIGWLETPENQIPEYKGPEPVITGGGDGVNAPQNTSDYSIMPDIEFFAEENPEYKPNVIKVKTDKEAYKPGDKVELTIDLSDSDLKDINNRHAIYYPKEDENNYYKTNSITRANTVFKTNLPGLDFVKSEDVSNNIENATIDNLSGLRKISFKIPENTKMGEYSIHGGFIDVEYGPWWWLKYRTYLNKCMEDVVIKVDSKVNAVDKKDADIDYLWFLIYDNPGMVSPEFKEDVWGNKSSIVIEPEHEQTVIKDIITRDEYLTFDLVGKKKGFSGLTLMYDNGEGEVKKETRKVLGDDNRVELKLPLKEGKNIFTIIMHTDNTTTATDKTYTLEVERQIDPNFLDDRLELSKIGIASVSRDGQLKENNGKKDGEIKLEKGKFDYETNVSYYVDKVKIGAETDSIKNYYGSTAKIYINGKEANKYLGNCPFNIYTDGQKVEYPISGMYSTDEAINLNVGRNLVEIVTKAENGNTQKYNLVINRLPDIGLESIEVENGKVETAGFHTGIKTIRVQAELDKEGNYGIKYSALGNGVVSRDIPMTKENVDKYGKDIDDYLIKQDTYIKYKGNKDGDKLGEHVIYVTEEKDGKQLFTKYDLEVFERSDDISGKVIEFKPGATQYPILPDFEPLNARELDGVFRKGVESTSVNLGTFGGSVTYKLDDPIYNDPNNPYGVDFIIYNKFIPAPDLSPSQIDNYTKNSLGIVYVAKDEDGDGNPDKWYRLAGSEEYTENLEQNYSVKYINKYEGVDWIDSHGNFGSLSSDKYISNDPVNHKWNGEINKDILEYSGARIKSNEAKYGYVGLNEYKTNQTEDYYRTPSNPYLKNKKEELKGDGFDISWAIDENGNAVRLDRIDFIKIQSGQFKEEHLIYAELATEIAAIKSVKKSNEELETTKDLTGLTINGEKLDLEDGKYDYIFEATEGDLDIKFDGMYDFMSINGKEIATGGTGRKLHFNGYDNLVVRIIVQSGKAAPKIYNVKVVPEMELQSIKILRDVIEIDVGEKHKIDYIVKPRIPKENLNISWHVFEPSNLVEITQDGIIKGIAPGKTKIRIICGEFFDDAIIVVKDNSNDVDRTKLTELVLEAKDLRNKLEKTKQLIGSKNLNEEEIKKASEELKKSIEKLIEYVKTNKDKLTDVEIDQVKEMIKFDSMNDTNTKNVLKMLVEGLNGFEKSYDEAKNILKDSKSTQKDIDKAKDNLINEILLLKNLLNKEDPIEPQPETPEQPEIPEKPEQPEIPEKPEQPEIPEEPAKPEIPEEPEQPTKPEKPEQPEQGKVEIEIPKDGKEIETEIGEFKIVSGSFDKNIGKVKLIAKEKDSTLELKVVDKNGQVVETKKPIEVKVKFEGKVKNKNNVTAILIKEDGTKVPVGGVYDEKTKTIKFLTNECGKFIVEEGKKEFKDTLNVEWAKAAIESMAVKGIVKGKPGDKFAPNANISRAEFATLASRMLKLNENVAAKSPFKDISKGAWYYNGVVAAYENGLINGKPGQIFDPTGEITREEIVKIIGTILKENGYGNSDKTNLNKLKDNSSISSWAAKEAAIAVNSGVVKGNGSGNFAPKAKATRAETAMMIYRLYELILK